jgi:hypothetical protein
MFKRKKKYKICKKETSKVVCAISGALLHTPECKEGIDCQKCKYKTLCDFTIELNKVNQKRGV